MKTYTLILLLLAASIGQTTAQPPRIPPEKPRLVVGIMIEQMRSDYISRFWDKFGEGGFKRLIGEGTFCRNASYGYFHTQTAVGYATVYTGGMPASHGIVADEWFDRVNGKTTTAVADDAVKTVGGSFDAGLYSPRNLLGTTAGDEMRLATLRQSKVFGVSLDPVAAIIPAGHTANGAFWLDYETGTWITSSYYMPQLPDWLIEENKKQTADLYLTHTWDTSFPVQQYTRCLTDENPYETGIEGRIVFPYVLPEIARGMSIANRYRLLQKTPFGNTLTKDMAIALMVNENLGKDEFTDLLAISFSATEHIGNLFGAMSIEVEDAFLKLDKELEHLLNFIDEFAGKENALIFLTSNHGAAQNPAFLADAGIPAGYFNSSSAISLLRSYLNALYGSGDWVKGYFGRQLYLNADLIEISKLKLDDFRTTVAQFMVQFTGVSNTITATSLQNNQYTSGYRLKMLNGYFPRRSGDVFINLHPGWVEKSTSAAWHNSAYPYDAHVPLIWYGWKVKRETITRPIDMTDVAPTISEMMAISVPSAATGQAIDELVR